ncbi:hypothetical protein ACFSOZ_11600 [Mesorhizobium newzealandense]|uniref:NACHT domain-containing protein n=1 Tax=Mesorhizobium newzealandense TaxID=1300302 RepID=A0ABW4U8B4_9HYPH
MTIDATQKANQERLKKILQDEIDTNEFERLVAGLVSRMLDVGIAVAKTGFQFGGDAGPAGRQGRRFRIETKRYADKTTLSTRELLGELDQALQADPALEGWFLAATKRVPEQLENQLFQHGDERGVPVIVIDCKPDSDIWSLTALCTADPDVLDSLATKEAGDLARALAPVAGAALEQLRRDCEAWQLGYERLRTVALSELDTIWSVPRTSIAKLGQDAAGGGRANSIHRTSVTDQLDKWWGTAAGDAPAAVIGPDGVGKTWACLDWMIQRKTQLPITMIIPAAAMAGLKATGPGEISRFLADKLFDLTGVRDANHWRRRLDRLLKRPASEGPVLTLMFDGLNQDASVPWLPLLRTLQDGVYGGRVRVIATTRKFHFEENLRSMSPLAVQPVPIKVGLYDDAELDAKLACEGLTRNDLHPELIPLARTPRLFALVIKFRERLVEAGSITPNRLLWEYGKDTLGAQGGRSFSEREWREWLHELAKRFFSDGARFTHKALVESASRSDLTESEVFSRISDLVDGNFVEAKEPEYQATAAIVSHALGLALLTHLDNAGSADAQTTLDGWLDPISGFDERAGILRAAVSIMVERSVDLPAYATQVLVAWLQTQNIPASHLSDLKALAAYLVVPILSAIKLFSYAQRSARLWAINAIRSLPHDDPGHGRAVVEETARWLRYVPRDVELQKTSDEAEARRSEKFISRIGIDRSGPVTVLGVEIVLVDHSASTAVETIPSLLEGFPLAQAGPVFEAAALSLAIRNREEIWEGLKWLMLLNKVDRTVATVANRALANDVMARRPEPDIDPDLGKRVGALLLALNSNADDDRASLGATPDRYRPWSYARDYANDPGRSFFLLERPHVKQVLEDPTLSLFTKLNRTQHVWLDPTFTPPDHILDDLKTAAGNFPVQELDTNMSLTPTDHSYEQHEQFWARATPDALATLVRRKIAGLGKRNEASRFFVAARIRQHTLMWDEKSAAPAGQLRVKFTDVDSDREDFAATNLMMMEILDLPALAQFQRTLRAGLGADLDFEEIVGEISADDADTLVAEFRNADNATLGGLLAMLMVSHAPLSEQTWNWLFGIAFSETTATRRSMALSTLAQFNIKRLGEALLARDWAWEPSGPELVNHYGSLALIDAAGAVPFDQLAARLAPWMLPKAARLRGQAGSETLLAAELLGAALTHSVAEPVDLGATVTIYMERREEDPFAFSISPLPNESIDLATNFKAAFDLEAREEARQRAVQTALTRMDEAKAAGAQLILAGFDSEDLRAFFREAPDVIAKLVEGAEEISSDFRRRVSSAEGLYIALCEAALGEQPVVGATLWRSLRKVATIRTIGKSGFSQLIHVPFRVRQTPQSESLLAELLDPENAGTDKDLLDLAIAASINGRSDWFSRVVAEDSSSGEPWREFRATVLSGFSQNNVLPVDDAWPEGEIDTATSRKNQAAKWRLTEACARFWWNKYLAAASPEEAFGAWIMFTKNADRRVLSWVQSQIPPWRSGDRLQRLKRAHVIFNMPQLLRACEKREKNLSEQFLGRKTFPGISPWA